MKKIKQKDLILIRRYSDFLPKKEGGTLAPERYYNLFTLYIPVTLPTSQFIYVQSVATIEFDTEVIPEGHPRYPQKYLPVENIRVAGSDRNIAIEVEDMASTSRPVIYPFTTHLDRLGIFMEYDPDRIKDISKEFADIWKKRYH